ncbi:MAG: polyprenyl synthetase family protein [Bacteroidales bacterium]
MKDQKELTELINQSLKELTYPENPQGLFDPIRYILDLGGKRIRPVLTLMSAAMYTPHPEKALQPALGIEVFHNFTLLHDDLMDKADRRRNKPTVHKKWDDNTAILSGDAMQIMAYQLIAQTPASKLHVILSLFSATALEICEGQQYDMEFESRDQVTEEEYIEMIRLKTAVLLGCALKTGAIIGGASQEDADKLYEFGENIGLAFQLKDDLLDVYADPEVFGKNIGGDILNNKKTFLLISALTNASAEQRAVLTEWLSKKEFDPAKKIALFTELYGETGAKELCELKMKQYFRKGIEAFHKTTVSTQKKAALLKLAEDLMYRES